MSNNSQIMIVGTGPMSIEYSKVFKKMGLTPIIVGRSTESVHQFKELTGMNAYAGGIEHWLLQNKQDLNLMQAIVATTEKNIGDVSKKLMRAGVQKILVEKPGGYDLQDIISVQQCAKELKKDVFVGYNRRFYQSVEKAKQLIEEDGGVKSFHFEFTEWSHVIQNLEKEEGVKKEWFMSNSTHLIDLAFYLGGVPIEISTYADGSLDWHPAGSIFVGAGKSDTGALFSYHSNWQAPGRWSLEILTFKNRYIFKPLESLQVQKIGSVQVHSIDLEDTIDKEFKPGLYNQVQAFLNNDHSIIPDIDQQVKMLDWYKKIRKFNS